MRIGHISKTEYSENIEYKVITLEEDTIPKIQYICEVDIEDEKSMNRFCRGVKFYARKSPEYKKLMRFLKEELEMDTCFFLNNVKQFRGGRVKIVQHHVGFTITDIIATVTRRRVMEHEYVDYTSVCEEVMKLHYDGKVAIAPLSNLMHQLIHMDDSKVFIPENYVPFGELIAFAEEYKEYMEPSLYKKYEKYLTLSETVEDIRDIIPDYLTPRIIRYVKKGVRNIDEVDLSDILDGDHDDLEEE